MLRRITPDLTWPLHTTASTRTLEQHAASALPAHTLMQRAGLATARLARAIAPHAQSIWVACGPGNNGGDGLEAAMHLQRWGYAPVVTLLAEPGQLPADAAASYARAREAGVQIANSPPERCELAIDALLGISLQQRPVTGLLREQLLHLHASSACVLNLDGPSALDLDTGCDRAASDESSNAIELIATRAHSIWANSHFSSQKTVNLSLLTLKPGLFTAYGRDVAGEVWWDDLDVDTASASPDAWLVGTPAPRVRWHASHKGSYGDVAVIGGAPGMTGAALLAARAALFGGAGRVFVGLLDASQSLDPGQPELMLRDAATLDLSDKTVVCGCGGGEAVRMLLPRALSQAPRLVLDADALNVIAQDAQLQSLLRARAGREMVTVLTPHPLEAARLLQTDTRAVQQHRLQAAQQLAERLQCTCLLKGSGSVIATPGQLPCINPTGNARLATAGTGDVLAGWIGACLAQGDTAHAAAQRACHGHGHLADTWPAHETLTADALAHKISHR
jgi:ADP-dependent NAD(P)H-hydrate dehydratase / NAD(P)H-hydrate epimerase